MLESRMHGWLGGLILHVRLFCKSTSCLVEQYARVAGRWVGLGMRESPFVYELARALWPLWLKSVRLGRYSVPREALQPPQSSSSLTVRASDLNVCRVLSAVRALSPF